MAVVFPSAAGGPGQGDSFPIERVGTVMGTPADIMGGMLNNIYKISVCLMK
jgi:hypothetical protein